MISIEQVRRFKRNHCEENEIVVDIMRRNLHLFEEPILDVGCGMGDIALHALRRRRATLIDIHSPSKDDCSLSSFHERRTIDFFDYVPTAPIKTILFAHSLQFLDEDPNKLSTKIAGLDPAKVILVLNENSDFIYEIIKWSERSGIKMNPEKEIVGFPPNYRLIHSERFAASVGCEDFDQLTDQVQYLLEIEQRGRPALFSFLSDQLDEPNFTINQNVLFYEKENK
jgi:hypothetical protein